MEDRLKELFKKYVEGESNSKERQVVEDFFKESQENGITPEQVRQDKLLKARLDKQVFKKTIYKSNSKRRTILVAAASVAVVFLSGLLFYLNTVNTLTTVVAQNGKQLRVVLPDSSVAFLNSGSILMYSEHMNENEERNINLKGEAYFEVSHDPSKPFIVESETMRTRVLGTRFVVSDYPGEIPFVVVRSGKVGVQPSDKDIVVIEKGQRVSYPRGHATVESVDAEDYYSWKDGKIVFNQADLKQVVSTLKRRFGVQIELKSGVHKDLSITGSYYDDRIEDVLKSLEFLYGIKYSTKESGEIYIEAK